MELAIQFEQFTSAVSALEKRVDSQGQIIDSLADLHNDITDWAVNTEHESAALEVMAILEQYIQHASKAAGTVNPTGVTETSKNDIVVNARSRQAGLDCRQMGQ